MSKPDLSPEHPGRSLLGAVRAHYPDLPPAERRLAELILNFPGDLAGYSASELARMAETSNAAVTRLVRRLRFANYDEMRRRAREEREAGSPLYLLDRSSERPDIEPGTRDLDGFVENLSVTLRAIDPAALNALADRLVSARRVYIAGFRHSYYLAGYLRWSLAHARADVHLLSREGETLGESLVDLSAQDVAIVFAFRRRVPAVERIVGIARQAGAAVAIACDPGYVGGIGADWIFRCQSRGLGGIDDHGPALALAHMLTAQVLKRGGPKARSRLARIDALHESLAELE